MSTQFTDRSVSRLRLRAYSIRSKEKPMRFAALDGWRGVCALLVCLLHFNTAVAWRLHSNAFILGSFLFVDFFFVLSGFVITHSYASKIGNGRELGRFMLRRFGRVWPLHIFVLAAWVTLALAALAVQPFVGHLSVQRPFTGNDSPMALLTNALLIHALGLHRHLTWNGPSWSISAEFWTYLVFGLFCLLPAGRRVGAAILLAAVAAGVVALLSPRYMAATYDYGFFRCVYGFFLGHLIYRLRTQGLASEAAWHRYASILELAVIALVVLFVSLAGDGPFSLAAPLVFGAVVFLFSFESGACSRILRRPPFRQFGAWSYSIYMVHALVLQILSYLIRLAEHLTGTTLRAKASVDGVEMTVLWLGNNLLMTILGIGFVGIVIVSASLTFRFVEEPSRRYFNALARGMDQQVRLAKIAE